MTWDSILFSVKVKGLVNARTLEMYRFEISGPLPRGQPTWSLENFGRRSDSGVIKEARVMAGAWPLCLKTIRSLWCQESSPQQCWEPATTVKQLLICEAVIHDLFTLRVLQGHPAFSFIPTQEFHLEQGSSTGEQANLGMVSFVPPTSTTSNVPGDQDLENKATFPDQIANFQTL